jgi:hypothetical protein
VFFHCNEIVDQRLRSYKEKNSFRGCSLNTKGLKSVQLGFCRKAYLELKGDEPLHVGLREIPDPTKHIYSHMVTGLLSNVAFEEQISNNCADFVQFFQNDKLDEKIRHLRRVLDLASLAK